jgi:hypothetical protein
LFRGNTPGCASIGRMHPFPPYNLLAHTICNNMAADGSPLCSMNN